MNFLSRINLSVNKAFEKRPFWGLLLVNMAFLALAIGLLPFSYECVDDRFLAWVTSGYLTGHPEYHAMYMHVFYAWIESRLYMMWPQIEWHTWLFVVIHLASLSVIGYCVVKTDQKKWVKCVSLLLLYFLEAYFLTHFQFTTTAGLAATAGMMLVVSRKKYGTGIVLFLVGVLIRYKAAMFCGVMVAALYPLVLLRQGFDKRQLMVLVLCAVGAAGLAFVDDYIYSLDPQWKKLLEADRLRGRVYDNSNMWRVYSNPTEEITREDLDGFGLPFPYAPGLWENRSDDDGYWDLDKLNCFLQKVEEYTEYKGIPGVKKVKNIPVQFAKFPLLSVIGAVLLLSCLISADGKREKIALVFAAFCFLALLAYVSLNIRLNVRSFLCGWLPLVFLPLCIVPQTKRIAMFLSGLAIVLAIVFVVDSMPESNQRMAYRKQKELVDYGKQCGAKYIYSKNMVYSETEYPFGIRHHGIGKLCPFCEENIDNEIVREGKCIMVVKKDQEDLGQTDLGFVMEEMKSNDMYVLYQLKEE